MKGNEFNAVEYELWYERKPCHHLSWVHSLKTNISLLMMITSTLSDSMKLCVGSVIEPSSHAWLSAICHHAFAFRRALGPFRLAYRGLLCGGRSGNVRVQLEAHCENHLSDTMEFPSTNTAPSCFNLLPPTVNSSGPMKQVKLFRPNLLGV